MPIEADHNLLHYRLLEMIGEGGMGQVWKAVDTTLDREVAVKILPAEFAGDVGRLQRFEREAKLLASVNHPNIAVVHGLHEDEGTHFLAMELVPGEDLSERLAKAPPTVVETLQIALRIVKALEAAHEKGVVHRDLKPANIRVSERGEVKVLDFGLAKELAAGAFDPDPDAVTRTALPTRLGTVLGTAGYMSPEQARGEPVDERTDIWAFGCILYEMLSGRRPFAGETATDKIVAVLKEEPDWNALPAATPESVKELTYRCLDKSLDARLAEIAHARPLLEDAIAQANTTATTGERISAPGDRGDRGRLLSRLGAAVAVVVALAGVTWWLGRRDGSTAGHAAPVATKLRSVAVLPFENISADAQGEVFTAGVHDDVITRLAQIAGLKTISRTSVLEYKDTPKSIPKIGRELGVAAIVEGGVQRAGDLVRINVKLIDTSNEENLWAKSYDRELSARNIFTIQSEIAAAIATALEAKLTPAEKNRLEVLPTTNFEAYDLYLQGMEAYKRPGNRQQDLLESTDKFRRAIVLDPTFALAYARLSHAHSDLYWQGGDHTESRLARAFEAAERAIELAPDLAEGHFALGVCFYVTRDYSRAAEEYEVAARSSPGDAELVRARAGLTRRRGGFEESIPQFQRLLELDPRTADNWLEIGVTHSYLGRYSVAERLYSKALEIAPDFVMAQVYMAVARTNREPTRASVQRELAALDPLALSQASLTGVAWRIGLQSEAYEELFDLLAPAGELVSQQEFDYPKSLLLAITHELAGNPAEAADAYRTAVELLEPLVAARSDYANHHSALGLAYAGLGRDQEAVSEGRRAVQLVPTEEDVFVGSWQLGDLGYIYVRTGNHEAAIDTFERYLSQPRLESAAALALDPRLKPLLDYPRFRELVGLAG